ncbi:MAG: bifunctional diaminohydroxyphosphoribosylaminopyrimidine deaminase/5-amino-6-(5-phosphoribosylamino)uracil reductase RibD [Verrucomicrobiota bacterium]
MSRSASTLDARFMAKALQLAQRAFGLTSPNPMVGAVLVQAGKIIGQGWHHRAGLPHAEVEAFQDALRHGLSPRGATLYVTLEPCCTHGRTPPCTEAIIQAGVHRVVAATTDPNPAHSGRGFDQLRRHGIDVTVGVRETESLRLNEAFHHWIVRGTPFVTLKSAMTLDGKIGTVGRDSKWITSPAARQLGMKLRLAADAILVGVNTVLADNPSLTIRLAKDSDQKRAAEKRLRRLVLDSQARTPLTSKVVSDAFAAQTTIVVSRDAPRKRIATLEERVSVWIAPKRAGKIDLRWLAKKLSKEQVTHLLVEGGGEVGASFLWNRLVQRVAFFYAPKVVGGRAAPKAVGGPGETELARAIRLHEVEWRRVGQDLMLTAQVS